jgi:hypothetical protein
VLIEAVIAAFLVALLYLAYRGANRLALPLPPGRRS